MVLAKCPYNHICSIIIMYFYNLPNPIQDSTMYETHHNNY
jgi:hypothetical protein